MVFEHGCGFGTRTSGEKLAAPDRFDGELEQRSPGRIVVDVEEALSRRDLDGPSSAVARVDQRRAATGLVQPQLRSARARELGGDHPRIVCTGGAAEIDLDAGG